MKNIVLVHGGFVDGAGWEGVYKILKRDGYSVSIVQNPTISLEDDVAVTKRTLATQDGPTILVGHSYGGAVITEANRGKLPVGRHSKSKLAPCSYSAEFRHHAAGQMTLRSLVRSSHHFLSSGPDPFLHATSARRSLVLDDEPVIE